MFDESKHPRDDVGRFIYSDGAGGTHIPTEAEQRRMQELGISKVKNVVAIKMDTEIQKKFDEATPKNCLSVLNG